MRKKTLWLVAAIIVIAAGSVWAAPAQESMENEESYRFLMASGPWDLSDGRIPIEEQHDDPYFQYVEEQLGIVPEIISWEWDGGNGFVQGLRLALAAGEPIEAIRPWQESLANELIEGGQAVSLDGILYENFPSIRNFFSDETIDVVRQAQGGTLYYLTQNAPLDASRFGFIRKDWLDRVGMDVPTTRDELVEVYRAFKAQDANGNGDPNDEIPVSGRELLRWFDDLFVMHGVSSWEGHPQWTWNPDKGILEAAAVSDAMKMALEFIRDLYAEGLMDEVMPVQTNAEWTAKLNAGRIGHYYHLIFAVPTKSSFAGESGIEDPTGLEFWAQMVTPPKVPGVPQQYNYYPTSQEPNFMILKNAKHPEKILQWLEWGSQEDQWYYKNLGIPEVDWTREGGELKILKERPGFWISYAGGYGGTIPEIVLGRPFGQLQLQFIQAAEGNVRALDNQGMPSSVYEGFEDYITTAQPLYREYASKFIVGDLDIDEVWDDYVEQWYANGGQTVTERATAWYKQLHGM